MTGPHITGESAPTWQRAVLALLALAYLGLALLYNLTVPLWESPDEVGHFAYAVHIAQHGALPRLKAGELGESHQPPLYYALAALWLLPVDLDNPVGRYTYNPDFVHAGQGGHALNASLHDPEERTFPYQGWALGLHLVRAFSSLLGLGTVVLTFHIARTAFPDHPTLPLLAAAITAFNPQFLFISASANNDNLLIFSTTALLWLSVYLFKRSRERPPTLQEGMWLGGWALVALLSKMLSVAILSFLFAALILTTWRRHGWQAVLRWLAPAALVVLVGSGWWWLRNLRLYGDLLGYGAYQETFSVNLRTAPMTPSEWRLFAKTQFHSYWGVFGWMNVYPPPAFFTAIRWLLALAGLGWLLTLARRRTRQQLTPALALLVGVLLAQEALMVLISQRADGSMWQGRYLFPAASASATLLAGGLLSWTHARPVRPVIAAAVALGLLAAALWMPVGVIGPAYAAPLTREQIVVTHPVGATFGDSFYLHGYDMEQEALAIKLTLYWEALRRPDFDYSVFVHLLDSDGELVGQDDRAPGAARNHPPTTWEAGEVVVETHRVPLIRAPQGDLQIRLGVYNWATGERLPARAPGAGASNGEPRDALTIDTAPRRPFALPLVAAAVAACTFTLALLLATRRRRTE